MSIHDGFLELAAAAIDFDLQDDEHAELARHLAGCDGCRRTAAAFREDAATIAYGTGPRLAPARSVEILATALRPPKSGPPLRLLGIAALIAVLGGGVIAAGMAYFNRPEDPLVAIQPSPSESQSAGPSTLPTAPPSSPPGPTPAVTVRPAELPTAVALPIRSSASDIGTEVRMAPGADGSLYVSIPGHGGVVVSLMDETGQPRSGWPILLPGVEACDLLLQVPDGSVRVVCTAEASSANPNGTTRRAFALETGGEQIGGWPVDVDHAFTGRMTGETLMLLVGGFFDEGGEPGDVKPVAMVAIEPDGRVRRGADVPFTCCNSAWAIGPDGVAYGTTHHGSSASSLTTDLLAFGLDGPRAGWPVTVEGNGSEIAFAADGRAYIVIGAPHETPAQTLVFDRDGHVLPAGSEVLEIPSTGTWSGAGNDYPGPPIVADDGNAFIISTEGPGSNTSVVGLDPAGNVMPGWPYQSNGYIQWTGDCGGLGDTGCGQTRTSPSVGPNSVLYLLMEASTSSAGGSVVAIGQDGQVRDGWPVGLTRAGAEFLSIVAEANGTAYALAIEPEPNGGYSATILSLAPSGRVDYATTILEP